MTFKCTSIVFVCIATICFFNYFPQFIYSDKEILINSSFNDGFSKWIPSKTGVEIHPAAKIDTTNLSNFVSPPETSVILSAPNFERAISLGQFIPPVTAGSLLHLSAYTKTIGITDGLRPWETARVILVGYDQFNKAMYNHPHLLVAQKGSSDWAYHERVFRIAENTAKLQLIIQLIHAKGQFFVKTLSLRPATPNPEFGRYRSWFIAIWTFLGLWVGLPLVHKAATRRPHALILLIALGILAGVLMPNSLKEYIGESILPSADAGAYIIHSDELSVFRLTFSIPELDKYKYGHFIMFGLLAATASNRGWFNLSTFKALVLTTLFAFATEVLQLFIPGRGPQLGDVLIDTAGIFTGWALSGFYRSSSINC
ncbi:hypothetical protein CWO84_16865 [Methylomonas sp. Kb3]|uniref:VanZ family protein n=1 Tax=Methylomonas sp. Kb3 TaxID=1611544 RepID=UPI000C3448E8|nr:VanZ family protein [Methylomonas sp. Kb3]PKD39382.1 hypothetical protein CWO84_16865 [Methylomonas sp. Kb3]